MHYFSDLFDNPLNAVLNPICHLLALLGAHHIVHVSRVRDKVLYMFRTGPLSNVRSISALYTRNRYMSC